MCRISRLVADTLSDQEVSLLQKIQGFSDDEAAIDPQVMEMLGHLRLIEKDSSVGGPKITALGDSVLYARTTRNPGSVAA